MFSIAFAHEPAFPFEGSGPLHRDAVIVMNDFVETCEVPLAFWTEADYERQWREGAQRLVDGASTSCAVTWMYDPAERPNLRWWAFYRRSGDAVTVREQLWTPAHPNFGPVDPASPYDVLDEYPEEPERVSEWHLTLRDFEAFVSGLPPYLVP